MTRRHADAPKTASDHCSPTQCMVLANLMQKPLTGYELGRLSRPPANFIWSITMSQLYPELARLAENGLVGFTEDDGPGPLARKTYAVTPAGCEALIAFLRGPFPVETHRDTLAIWALSGSVLGASENAAVWQRETARLESDARALRERWERTRMAYGRPALPRPPQKEFGPWAALEMAARRKDGEAGFAAAMVGWYADAAPASARQTLPAPVGDAERLTPLKRTLLALLAVRPRTGYDFSVVRKPPANLIWSVGLSQIYPELGKLAKDGLASFVSSAGRGPLAKKTYTITEAGRGALRDDVLLPRPPEAHHSMLALWAHGSWVLGPPVAAGRWRAIAAELTADAAALERRCREVMEPYGVVAEPTAMGFASWAAFQTVIRRRQAEAGFALELAGHHENAIGMPPLADASPLHLISRR